MALSLVYHKIIAMEVRPLRTEEGLVYRQLRLSALSDTPDAFGDTLSDALVRPQQWWIDRVHEISRNSDREVIFVAFDHHEPCGLLYVRLDVPVAHIYGMWVAPAQRRRGNGIALMNAGLLWARTKEADRAELWVAEGNTAATRLYEGLGFHDTGMREAIRPGSAIRIRQMILKLADNRI
jgi:ribosomal protein S18 acetylase RimI-like enzyme